jgi:hypothetical protein
MDVCRRKREDGRRRAGVGDQRSEVGRIEVLKIRRSEIKAGKSITVYGIKTVRFRLSVDRINRINRIKIHA